VLCSQNYRGRFAPSPTGDLHFGSLVTAMASYADALFNKGTWIVRIDDIDSPRVQKGATYSILKTLDKLGFLWDERIYYQSENKEQYTHLINKLLQQNIFYRCDCSRKKIQAMNPDRIYSGICKTKSKKTHHTEKNKNYALRVNIPADKQKISFVDSVQGSCKYQLDKLSGDFIVYRSDQMVAYHLAFVIDNYLDNITHIIRGYDLLDSTPKQLFLQSLLSYPIPQYAHIPIITNANGIKLSKSCHAKAVDTNIYTLIKAAKMLGQTLKKDIQDATIEQFWQELVSHWNINNIPKVDKLKQVL
jgi:glutamyl-Q tRNA(Asp) synthetase